MISLKLHIDYVTDYAVVEWLDSIWDVVDPSTGVLQYWSIQ